VGKTVTSAESTIRKDGFTVAPLKHRFSTTVAKNNVISQTPVSGGTAAKGSAINLVVSKGKPPAAKVKVPDVVNLPVKQAKTDITTAGLKYQVVSVPDTSGTPGTVVGQTPTANTLVPKNSTVTIKVVGPLTVPSVVGESVATASQQLSGPPWNYVVSNAYEPAPSGSGLQPGQVIGTSPGAGTKLAAGSNITIEIVQAASPTTSPSPTPSSPSPSPSTSPGGANGNAHSVVAGRKPDSPASP
jgi:eukaryotic-like serine/threonine-protein kinase